MKSNNDLHAPPPQPAHSVPAANTGCDSAATATALNAHPASLGGQAPAFMLNLDRHEGGNAEGRSATNSPFFHSFTGIASTFTAEDHLERRHLPYVSSHEGVRGDHSVVVVPGAPEATAAAAAGELAKQCYTHRSAEGPVDNDGEDAAAGANSNNNRQHPHLSESFWSQPYVKELPEHLVPLVHEIHQLDEDDLAYISDVTHTMANRDLYSLLPYTGSNWFLPSIRECEDDEKHWELCYTWRHGLIIAIGGRRLSIRLLNVFIRVCFIVLIWFMLWNVLPRWLVEPGGYVWDPVVLVVVSAIIGGLVCRVIQMPPLVGVLWMGIMWSNIPTLRYLTGGVVKEVSDICSKMGLTVILARAGYKLAIKEIIPHWKQTALLATMPFALEGVAHSLIANRIFEYNGNYNWAFLQGMLCSIVSPAVVVPGSLYLQDLGYGRGVGPLSLMLSAVGIEIVLGVWSANFLIALIFYEQRLAIAILLGPVQFIGGILLGVALGIVFYYTVELIKQEADRLPNGKYTHDHLKSCMDFSYAIFLSACYTMVFFGYKVSLAGGGCVMCVFFSATVAHMWSRTGKEEHENHKKYIASWLAFTWDEAMMPCLFATMGAKINITAIFNGTFLPKAVICMVCSTAVRLAVTFTIQLGSGMPYKEKLLVCVGYLGKASAQASVGPIAANLVANMVAVLPPDQKHSLDTMVEYANNVQQISAMYVMFMACIASFGLVRGGQLVLKRDGDGKKKKKGGSSRKTSQQAGATSPSGEATAAPTGLHTGETVVGTGADLKATRGTVEMRESEREGSHLG